MKWTYQNAGVHRSLGEQASQIFYAAAKQTWSVREGGFGEVLVPFDDFSGLRAVDVSGLPPGTLANLGFDGVGTKIGLAERTGCYRTLAFDLFAMVCDDAVVRGAEPVLVGSILDVNRLKRKEGDFLPWIRELAEGYVEAARAAGVVVINGEVAELGGRVQGVGEFACNWGASVLWFARKERLLTGRKVKVGDAIVGFRERGFRANGFSLVRGIFNQAFGSDWHQEKWEGRELGTLSLCPSILYTRCMNALGGGVFGVPKARIHGAAHITGGGIPEKLGRLLRVNGLGASLEALWEPPPLMLHAQRLGKVDEHEAYATWNMGQGMLLCTPEPDVVVEVAKEFGLEARWVGEVTENPFIRLRSQGAFEKGKWLSFPKAESACE